MPRNHGTTFEQWGRCERCGRDYPLNQMTRQNGVVVCFERCFDNTDIQERERLISEILGQEEPQRDDDRFTEQEVEF